MNSPSADDHWLVRPTTITWLIRISVGVLALTIVAQFFISIKGYVGYDGWFAFGAVFGFLCCVLMVVLAKLLGFVLKRSEDYYRKGDDDA